MAIRDLIHLVDFPPFCYKGDNFSEGRHGDTVSFPFIMETFSEADKTILTELPPFKSLSFPYLNYNSIVVSEVAMRAACPKSVPYCWIHTVLYHADSDAAWQLSVLSTIFQPFQDDHEVRTWWKKRCLFFFYSKTLFRSGLMCRKSIRKTHGCLPLKQRRAIYQLILNLVIMDNVVRGT